MQYKYLVGGKEREVDLEKSGEALHASLEGREFDVQASPISDGSILVKVDGRNYTVWYARDEKGLHVVVKGLGVLVAEPGAAGAGASGADFDVVDGKQVLIAPMPGQVVKVNVCKGDEVSRKQCLVIVEAMKMENELATAIDGVVTAVHVEAGQQVDALQPLVEVTQKEA
jgi:biotin carboxyl carrier protein